MTTSTRINLLIPYLDGEYYGTIFTILHSEANKRGAALIAILANAGVENPTSFHYHVGAESADGWLIMMNPQSVLPANLGFLRTIASTGKPIVTIGYREQAIASHSIVIDNRQATKEAVLHLIREHGHRRIAFVGSMEHVDLVERFEGYKEALFESGIIYDETLYYRTSDSIRLGGTAAAKSMLAKGIDFTAVFASTDLNAIGMIETLQQAGYRIPEDIAVVGFDDLPSAEAFHPPLTTVRQSFSSFAEAGFELLYQQIMGKKPRESVTYLPTEFIVRASCGCPYRTQGQPITEIHNKLAKAQTNIDLIVQRHYQLASNWVAATRKDKFHLSNMFREVSKWGCLALWDPSEKEHKHLIIKQAFSNDGDPVPPIGYRIPMERFPPAEWIPKMEDHEYVRIQAIRTDKEDLGFVMIVAPIDKLVLISGADINRISFLITVAALERDRLFHQVQSIAEQLEIVSRTTNDGIWDWDLAAGRIHWNIRSHDMLNSIGETLTGEPEAFFRLIHPEDYDAVMDKFRDHLENGASLKLEFRIRGRHEGQQLWVFAAGDSIRDENGRSVRIIGSLTNITEKKLAEKQITHLAFHDVLTGLPNRKLFQDRFHLCKEQANRYGYKLGVLLIDLDRFKVINDTMGHQAGDELLKQVADMLDGVVRSSDSVARGGSERSTVARFGGDEFIVLLTHIHHAADLQRIGDRIIRKFKEPFLIQGIEMFTTASMGISMYPDDADQLDALIRSADIAMYKAKENGKNRSELYNSHTHSLTIERFSMENQLRKGLERREFVLHYQPQVKLNEDKIYGVEALIRWNSSDRGWIYPTEFIPLAEETGWITEIGQWVLREACSQMKSWIDQGLPGMVMSVNISASQLHQKDFVDLVKTALAETRLPPGLLCLEITESTAIKNLEVSSDKLRELSEFGVRIAIDDFGTGYSSLSMLKHLPIQNVKIDRSFICDMVNDADDGAIVRAVIAMAHSLGLWVTAEGVETEDQIRILSEEKCNAIQGFIVSRPLPAEECLLHIRNYNGR
ncbi:EAL domain-containing protein [Cohnella caldifontis]|uniref:EAL domain-containing protein n=1 Tax=Cohnella caldifontis TaxID=3027471 RepID=UPI0023EAD96C|nr:EAL domain-containing protein [Cohnella sp. YIM B05605]